MTNTLIYSCIFFNENYINLINLLIKTYILFGNHDNNIDYLIISNPHFKKKILQTCIFKFNNFKPKIWTIDLYTLFHAAAARLIIFQYQHIKKYKKILYLDSDILITNQLYSLLNFPLENKLYVLKENHDRESHFCLFNDSEYTQLNKNSAFTSGILLFNNSDIIKNLFIDILKHINNHLENNNPIPACLEQPFIIYHSVKKNLYDNTKLNKLVINNPTTYNYQVINHFPGGPGKYVNKIIKMSSFMNNVIFNIKNTFIETIYMNNPLINKKYNWGNSFIYFLDNGNMEAFGKGQYSFINKYLIKANFGGRIHLMKFNKDYKEFSSIRKEDFQLIVGTFISTNNIPKIIMQTSPILPKSNIINIINKYCPGWKYEHFIDEEIIKYFINNPIKEFPFIIDKFNSFTKGQHKADLFRYYYLYLNGGVFLDSDAIFQKNIDEIISIYDAIFVKSFMPNSHLFNGFICTFPKNPIIYDALQHAYKTQDNLLQKNYHYLCEELLSIYNKHNLPNTKIYNEYNKTTENYGGSVILDDNGEKIISHYWQNKDFLNQINI